MEKHHVLAKANPKVTSYWKVMCQNIQVDCVSSIIKQLHPTTQKKISKALQLVFKSVCRMCTLHLVRYWAEFYCGSVEMEEGEGI